MRKLLLLLAAAAGCYAQTTTINGIYGQSIGIPIYAPSIVQQGPNGSTGSTGKTITATFAANTTAGTTLIFACGGSNYAASSWTATATDSLGNAFTQDVIANQSTTEFAAIFRATNGIGGADTITLTIAGASSANESLACRPYEMLGNFVPASPLDQSNTGSNSGSTSPSAGSVTPSQTYEYAFAVFATGATSSPTLSVGTSQPWKLDSGSVIVGSGSLVFGIESLPVSSPTVGPITGNATLSASNAWAAAIATYKVFIPVVVNGPSAATIGKVDVLGNGGATLDSAPQATAPTDVLAMGAAAVSAEQTAATNGQAQRMVTDLVGKLIALPYANPENFISGSGSATDTSSTAIIASAGGSLRNYITSCQIVNTGSTTTYVNLNDGSTTLAVELAYAPGGSNIIFPAPLRGTAATAFNFVAGASNSTIYVSCQGYKGL